MPSDLFDANGTPIASYGVLNVKLNLVLLHNLSWPFMVADVAWLIDFHLTFHKLIINPTDCCLIHTSSRCKAPGKHLATMIAISYLLQEFSQLFSLQAAFPGRSMTGIFHHIETSRPLVCACPRHLPECLQAAKVEFDSLVGRHHVLQRVHRHHLFT